MEGADWVGERDIREDVDDWGWQGEGEMASSGSRESRRVILDFKKKRTDANGV